jgi:hypothetical protein
VFQADEQYHPEIGDGLRPRTCFFCETEDLTEEQMIMHALLNELHPPSDEAEEPPCRQLGPACEEAMEQFALRVVLQEVPEALKLKSWEVVYDSLNLFDACRSPAFVKSLIVNMLSPLGSRKYDGKVNGLDDKGCPVVVRERTTSRDSKLSHLATTLVNKDAISSIPVATAVSAALDAMDGDVPVHKVFEEQKAAASGQNRARGFKLPHQYHRIP